MSWAVTAVLGGTVAGGALGYGASKLGARKAKGSKQGVDPQFLKRTPPHKTEPGALAFEELKRRLQGLGIGIPESVFEEAEGPIAKPFQTQFQRVAIPEIKAAASAAGVGRSTIVPAQIGFRGQQLAETVGSKLAQLRVANEELKRREMTEALAGLERFGTRAAGASAAEKQLSIDEFKRQQEVAQEISDIQTENRRDMINKILKGAEAGGTFVATKGASGTSGLSSLGVFKTQGGDNQDTISLIDEILKLRDKGAVKNIQRR